MLPRSLLAPALSRIGAVLNRNLEQSTPGRAQRARLAGRSFAIAVTGLALRVRIAVAGDRLEVALSDEAADAEVSGGPLALVALLRAEAPPAGGTAVAISGDPEIAQSFQKLLRIARPELEAELARLVGEAPAQLAARAAQSVLAFAQRVRSTATHSAAEYLTEESRDLPARAEADRHLREVDRLRDDVDRADARLALLEQRLRADRT